MVGGRTRVEDGRKKNIRANRKKKGNIINLEMYLLAFILLLQSCLFVRCHTKYGYGAECTDAQLAKIIAADVIKVKPPFLKKYLFHLIFFFLFI